ncbi:MAG: hypothetical protein GXW96_10960 [Christensenellaceae bacterium]|nr:hypothetical protein [Christensenellaceae bacterium]
MTALCVMLALPCLPASSAQAALAGDVDGDGAVSAADYTLLRLHLLGKMTLAGAGLSAADMDGSGALTVNDYVWMRLLISCASPVPALRR